MGMPHWIISLPCPFIGLFSSTSVCPGSKHVNLGDNRNWFQFKKWFVEKEINICAILHQMFHSKWGNYIKPTAQKKSNKKKNIILNSQKTDNNVPLKKLGIPNLRYYQLQQLLFKCLHMAFNVTCLIYHQKTSMMGGYSSILVLRHRELWCNLSLSK